MRNALLKSANDLIQLTNEGLLKGFALIGGMALSTYIEPRATADIDYVIGLGTASLEGTAQKLKGTAHRGDVFDPLAGSVSYTVKDSEGKVTVQLIQMHPGLEEIALDKVMPVKIEKVTLPVISLRGLVILKLYAGGSVDLEDARKLLASKKLKKKDKEYIEKKVQKLRIKSRLRKVCDW